MIDRVISTSSQRIRNLVTMTTPRPEDDLSHAFDLAPASSPAPEGKPMTAFSHLADRMKAMRQQVEQRRAEHSAKIEDIETRAHAALDKQAAILAAEEADLREFENEVNQATNGGPA